MQCRGDTLLLEKKHCESPLIEFSNATMHKLETNTRLHGNFAMK